MPHSPHRPKTRLCCTASGNRASVQHKVECFGWCGESGAKRRCLGALRLHRFGTSIELPPSPHPPATRQERTDGRNGRELRHHKAGATPRKQTAGAEPTQTRETCHPRLSRRHFLPRDRQKAGLVGKQRGDRRRMLTVEPLSVPSLSARRSIGAWPTFSGGVDGMADVMAFQGGSRDSSQKRVGKTLKKTSGSSRRIWHGRRNKNEKNMGVVEVRWESTLEKR